MPFIGVGAQVTDEMIEACLKGHTINDARPQIGGDRLITMGVDQGKTGYISVVEWLFDQHPGSDISAAAIGKLLWFGKFAEDDWGYLGELMREWQVLACVVDADPNVNDARRFAKKFHGYVWLTRYRRGQTAKEVALSEEETGAPFATVDRTSWLSCTLGRFKTKPPRILLPRDITLEYREHVKNLVRTYEKDDTGNLVADVREHGTGPLRPQPRVYADIGLTLAPIDDRRRRHRTSNVTREQSWPKVKRSTW